MEVLWQKGGIRSRRADGEPTVDRFAQGAKDSHRMRLLDDSRCFAFVALTICLLSASCKHTSQGRTTTAPTTDPGSTTWSASDMEKLDVLVTPEMLFPEDHPRALFESHPPTTEENTRTYTFELKPQPGMVTPRHFFLVLVSFTHLSGSPRTTAAPSMVSTGGPNGSFVEASGTTADSVYAVRVSQAMLLPDGVRLSPFHPQRALVEVLHRYETWNNPRTPSKVKE
jgi:hypothetical protein